MGMGRAPGISAEGGGILNKIFQKDFVLMTEYHRNLKKSTKSLLKFLERMEKWEKQFVKIKRKHKVHENSIAELRILPEKKRAELRRLAHEVEKIRTEFDHSQIEIEAANAVSDACAGLWDEAENMILTGTAAWEGVDAAKKKSEEDERRAKHLTAIAEEKRLAKLNEQKKQMEKNAFSKKVDRWIAEDNK